MYVRRIWTDGYGQAMPKRNIIWVIAIITATATAMWVMRSGPNNVDPSGPERFSRLAGIVSDIQQRYYRTLDPEELNRLVQTKGLRGVASLDEFTTYVPYDKVEAFQQRMGGTGCGLGLRTRQAQAGPPIVTAVLYDSPAYRADIQVGWRIVRIDDRPASEFSPLEIRKALCPAPGVSVSLVLDPAGQGNEQTFRLTSKTFDIESVTGLYLGRDPRSASRWAWTLDEENAIVYIRVREIVPNTVEKFAEAFRGVKPVRALVLDLRGNPGGESTAARRLADMFLSEGLIVRELGQKDDIRNPEHGTHHNAQGPGTLADIPIVVLVDERTASGAELVAGALWANHRAVLVGTRTRGKWCAQSMIPLDGGNLGLLNLTIYQFVFSRGGAMGHGPAGKPGGIQPHETVELEPANRQALADLLAEAEPPPGTSSNTSPVAPAPVRREIRLLARLLELDSQLRRALELLRKPEAYNALLEAERLRAKRLQGSGKGPGSNSHSSGNDD